MLKEFASIRQDKIGYRRLFLDDSITLYVWYTKKNGEMIGFQVTYLKDDETNALTWTREEGYSHGLIEGWDSSRFNVTPILIAGGTFDYHAVREYLAANLDEVEEPVSGFILKKLDEYTQS